MTIKSWIRNKACNLDRLLFRTGRPSNYEVKNVTNNVRTTGRICLHPEYRNLLEEKILHKQNFS